MAIVGAYLLYTAYELFQGRNDPNTTMTPFVMYLFIALFVIAAGGLFVFAWRLWKGSREEEEEKPEREDENSLKG